MVFEDKMHEVIGTLEQDGIIVFPTDTIWAAGCNMYNKKACKKLKELVANHSGQHTFTLLASGLKMIKKYIPRIHPRIETLLVYHHHPLTVIHPGSNHLPEYVHCYFPGIGVNITNDVFCKTVIRLLGSPLIITPAQFSSTIIPNSYQNIHPAFIHKGNYICRHKRDLISDQLPPVTITYDEDGELIFLTY